MNPLADKITAAILDAPGDLQGVPPVVVRAVVARALAELPEAILPRTLPEEDDRLDRYTLRDLLEEEWVACEDGSVWLERETASDIDGAIMPKAYWEEIAKRARAVRAWGEGVCDACGAALMVTVDDEGMTADECPRCAVAARAEVSQ